jgi:membrane peptidoglycan carboxypeptidase
VAARPDPAETILKLVGVIVACAVLAAGLVLPYVGGLGMLAGRQADKFLNTKCNLIETPPPQKTILYAKDRTTGKLSQLATLFTYDRELVKLSQVPKYLQQALIATEDRRFYSHKGVDMRGLIRSAVNSSSGDTQGGSTLTMQYVKQVRYYQADTDAERESAISQTLSRKMEDAQCALDIEKKDTKDQILEKYLNIAFFGENSYGIGVAAKNFFGHSVAKLTLPEAALLVGVVKAPTEFDPFVPANRKAAIERRNQVIQNLADVGDISQAAADKYKATALSLATTSQHAVRQGCAGANPSIKNAGFFCDYVVDWLERGGISSKTITTGGLKIVTTIDPNLQNTVQQSLWDQVPAASKTTAIMPIVEPSSGNVLAMGTSKIYGLANDGKHTTVPVFTNASAGAGSTYKYFSLLAALKVGVPADWQLSANEDGTYTTQHCGDPGFQSKNDSEGHGFGRTETLTSATAKSSNTYYVALEDQLFGDCELAPIVNMALDLGMGALNQRDTSAAKGSIAQNVVKYTQPTFTLGFAPTSPLQLTGAYATVANDGEYCQPAPVTSIKDANGKDMEFQRQPCTRQVTRQVARNALKLLTGDTKGQGTSAAQFQNLYSSNPGLSIAGKTGTVNASDNHGKQLDTNADLWFVGLTPDMAATTALFNIDTSTKPIVGLQGMTDEQAGHLTGAFAAGVWVNALTPALLGKQWLWPDPNAIPNAAPVPNVVGRPFDEAKDQLVQAGFKVSKYPFQCGSDKIYGTVAFQSATNVAESGANITLCLSNGQPPNVYKAPPPPVKKTKPPVGTSPGATRSRGPGHH